MVWDGVRKVSVCSQPAVNCFQVVSGRCQKVLVIVSKLSTSARKVSGGVKKESGSARKVRYNADICLCLFI